ncbi:uncharacterized protein NKAPD1-like isoform X2 [Anneissia japonica]|uniref:uncharacterized protein NKAPD1-like isoform X2 n=1 Tax=Anneissia japonica TaxID=1529436 RepID=UPI00142572CD|nr:uncharacterized protein NKAPD1-like isoform X2 [Anneissia japonica]
MDSETKIQVRYLDRKFFRNMVRHTNVHNRMQEEQEMWRAREVESKQKRKRSHSQSSRRSKHKKSKRVQETDEYHRHANNLKRELTKCDPLNSDRWTHNGFLELYPEETNFKISTDEGSEEEGKRKKKRKKHKR